jgi:hypothetical protein
METEMKNFSKQRRGRGLRSRPAAFGLLAAAAALLITATLIRSAMSLQAPPDLAADALPQLNRLGRHAAEAAEYAKQVKARYTPTAPEYLEARRRYEAAAESFNTLVEALNESVKGDSGGRDNAAIREKVRAAVREAEAFAAWVEGGLRLMRRGRGPGGKPRKDDETEESAAEFARAFGPKEERIKGRAVELMAELVKFKPWDKVPPVGAAGAAAAPSPAPSPTPLPPNS